MPGQKRNISLAQLSTAEKAGRRNVLAELSTAIKTARDLNPTSSNALVLISRYKVLYPWISKNMVYNYMLLSKLQIRPSRVLLLNQIILFK